MNIHKACADPEFFSGGGGGRDIFFPGHIFPYSVLPKLKKMNFQGWGGGLDPPTPTPAADPRMHMVYIL